MCSHRFAVPFALLALTSVWGCGSDDGPAVAPDVVDDVPEETGGQPDVPIEPDPFVGCVSSDDCPSGWCLPSHKGMVCSLPCLGDCPDGFECRGIANAGADPIFLCVDLTSNLCQPCKEDKDCNLNVPGEANKCLSFGHEGNFCGLDCSEGAAACPEGYTCSSVEGGLEQCLPDSAMCECNGAGKALQAETFCSAENEIGTCTGTRRCGAFGLGECTAGLPDIEICDGKDNNCNDKIDEGLEFGECEKTNAFGTCYGESSCIDGLEGCSAPTPKPETCNFLDDDCDGETDEDVGSPCGTCSSVCVFGAGDGKEEPFMIEDGLAENVQTNAQGGLVLAGGATDGYVRKLLKGWPTTETLWDQTFASVDAEGADLSWVEVRFRVAETESDLMVEPWVGPLGPYPPALFPIDIKIVGSYMEIEFRLRSNGGASPVLNSWTVIAYEETE